MNPVTRKTLQQLDVLVDCLAEIYGLPRGFWDEYHQQRHPLVFAAGNDDATTDDAAANDTPVNPTTLREFLKLKRWIAKNYVIVKQ